MKLKMQQRPLHPGQSVCTGTVPFQAGPSTPGAAGEVMVVGGGGRDVWDSVSLGECGLAGRRAAMTGLGAGEPDCELGGAGLAVLMTSPLTHHTVGPGQQNLGELSHFAWSWAREK